MGFMQWSDEFAFGLDGIDGQHQWLFSATNALHDALSAAQPDRAVIGALIEGLVDYTMNHFVAEEELFQRSGYAQAEAHKAEHDRFTASAFELLTKFEAGEPLTLETMDFLKSWLTHHIQKVDRAYVPYMQSINASN